MGRTREKRKKEKNVAKTREKRNKEKMGKTWGMGKKEKKDKIDEKNKK